MAGRRPPRASWWLAVGLAAVGCHRPPARLSGGFIAGWTGRQDAAFWTRALGEMKELGMDTVVLQHATFGHPGEAFYAPNAPGLPAPSGDLYGSVLAAAEAVGGLRVFLGLGYRDDWKYEGTGTAAAYAALARFNVRVADDLYRRFGRSPAFGGWYVPQEADSQRTWEPVSDAPGTPLGRLLDGYYRPLMAHLKALDPGRPIAIAPFFGYGAMDPATFTAWWTLLLQRCPVDILMMQDGIGVYHAGFAPHPAPPIAGPPFMDARVYLAGARDACVRAGKSFWIDLELFREVREDESVPAPWGAATLGGRRFPGVREQLERDAALLTAHGPQGDRLVCYEFLDDLCAAAPGGGHPGAAALNRAYRAFLSLPAQ